MRYRPTGWLALAAATACVGMQLGGCAPAAEPSEQTLRLLTYNIKHGLGLDGVEDLERAAELIRELKPDLVALQEIDQGAERSGGVMQAERLGELTGMHPAFGKFMDYQGGEYGLAVLSRFEIVEAVNHVLPPGREPRSALAVRVEPEGQPLLFVSLHLYATEEERLSQAEKIVELVGSEDAPVILAGDFNSQPGDAVMSFLGESFTVPSKNGDRFTFRADEPTREIDFILLRPGERFEVIESRVIDESNVSDHRPVLTVVRLRSID